VGSYPTVSPLPSAAAYRNSLARAAFRPSEGFTSRWPPRRLAPAVCFLWHCPWPQTSPSDRGRRIDPLALPGALPFLVRGAFRRGLSARDLRPRCPDFPPGQPLAKHGPAITRPIRQNQLYIDNGRHSSLNSLWRRIQAQCMKKRKRHPGRVALFGEKASCAIRLAVNFPRLRMPSAAWRCIR
jgi:hypothetical protein